MLKTLLYLIIILSPLSGAESIRDSSDFVEINHVYRHNSLTNEYEKSFTQIIWWEWRDYVLVRTPSGHTRTSDFVVKDYRVTWSSSSRPRGVVSIRPKLLNGKWVCIFYDKNIGIAREIVSNWKTETHTSFDVEVKNRDIVSEEYRNKLSR